MLNKAKQNNFEETIMNKAIENKNNIRGLKRQVIRKYIGRNKVYRLSTYIRNVYKATGEQYKASTIRAAIAHMTKEGQITATLVKGPKGAEYVVGALI